MRPRVLRTGEKAFNIVILVKPSDLIKDLVKDAESVRVWCNGKELESQDIKGLTTAYYLGKSKATSFGVVSPFPWKIEGKKGKK